MILTRMGVVAASKSSGSAPPVYYTIAISGSYDFDGRPNNVDLYWDSGSGYNYVATVTSIKQTCNGIATLTVLSGSAAGLIKFVDPGNCDVAIKYILNDPVCANYDSEGCEIDLGTPSSDTTHAVVIKLQNNDPFPATFICC